MCGCFGDRGAKRLDSELVQTQPEVLIDPASYLTQHAFLMLKSSVEVMSRTYDHPRLSRVQSKPHQLLNESVPAEVSPPARLSYVNSPQISSASTSYAIFLWRYAGLSLLKSAKLEYKLELYYQKPGWE
jgi:hypothetical protein